MTSLKQGWRTWRLWHSLVLALLGSCAAPPASSPLAPATRAAATMPEAASGWTAKPGWQAQRFMVAAAHPLAADAGYQILREGGSAVDAAVAVQMVLALVEPQSSGIGGGAFLMHWDGQNVEAWDGRETAPAKANPRAFLAADGTALPSRDALFGGRAVATPGLLKMLQAAHQEHGRLPWARLFEPAVTLAEQGFAIGPRLHSLLASSPHLRRDPLALRFYYDTQGQARPVGHVLRNAALAHVLRAVAQQGSSAMVQGAIAVDLVKRVREHAVPGPLTLTDLAAYEPKRRQPICTDWMAQWRVCGFPPPSSGHLAIMQTLGVMSYLQPDAKPLHHGVPSADWLHSYFEAARLAFADRAQFVGDPDFVVAPAGGWASLLAPAYLRQRAALIGPQRMPVAPAGQPGANPLTYAPMAEQVEHGTSHISIVDELGHAVAMTSSIEYAFGAGVMADGGTGKPGGYLLNNQMTDFSALPADAQGRPVANRIEPGKRPRSSMSPTLVFDKRDGRLAMSLGSAGGPVIIHCTAKTLLGTLAWGLDAQRAIDLPYFGAVDSATLLEKGRFPAATLQALRARGHSPLEFDLPTGAHAIQRTPGAWFGGADPRKEGVVRGD